MRVDLQGVVAEATQVPSPNCDSRPPGVLPELLVVHCISLPPGQFGGGEISALFTNTLDPGAHAYFREIAGLRVSAHFLVRRGGELIQYVPCGMRAWHAGLSRWGTRNACNDFSIGVELEGTETAAFESAQYRTLADLAECLASVYPLGAILGHSDIAPGRKHDPGAGFDWPLLRSLVSF